MFNFLKKKNKVYKVLLRDNLDISYKLSERYFKDINQALKFFHACRCPKEIGHYNYSVIGLAEDTAITFEKRNKNETK